MTPAYGPFTVDDGEGDTGNALLTRIVGHMLNLHAVLVGLEELQGLRVMSDVIRSHKAMRRATHLVLGQDTGSICELREVVEVGNILALREVRVE